MAGGADSTVNGCEIAVDQLESWIDLDDRDAMVVLVRDPVLSRQRIEALCNPEHQNRRILLFVASRSRSRDDHLRMSDPVLAHRRRGLAMIAANITVCEIAEEQIAHVLDRYQLHPTIEWSVTNCGEFPELQLTPAASNDGPSPLVFIKVSGKVAAPVNTQARNALVRIGREIVRVQERNLVVLIGSSPYAEKLASELGVQRLPERIERTNSEIPLSLFQAMVVDGVQESASVLRSCGIPAVGVVGSRFAKSVTGKVHLHESGIAGVVGLLHMGAVPVLIAGAFDDESGRYCDIPSIDELGSRLAERLCPDLTIISTAADGILDKYGLVIRNYVPGVEVDNINPDSVTPGVSDSISYYSRFAAASLRVVLLNAGSPALIGRALSGQRGIGTEFVLERADSVPVPRTGYATVFSHQELLADRRRVAAFREALMDAGVEGKRVIDFGTGSGILGAMAANLGAKNVIAIEHEQIAEATRIMADLSRYHDRIKVVRGLEVSMGRGDRAKQADLIVSETVGSFGVNTHALEALMALRDRTLRPGGIMIPKSLELLLCPAWSASVGARMSFFDRWLFGWPVACLQPLISNQPFLTYLKDSGVLATPAVIHTVDLGRDRGLEFSKTVSFVLRSDAPNEQPQCVNCLVGWVRMFLTDKVILDTGPTDGPTSWYQVAFPLSRPIGTFEATELEVRIGFSQSAGLHHWEWDVKATHDGTTVREISQSGYQSYPSAPTVIGGTPYAALDWSVWKV